MRTYRVRYERECTVVFEGKEPCEAEILDEAISSLGETVNWDIKEIKSK